MNYYFREKTKSYEKVIENKTIYIIYKNYKLYITQYFKLFAIWVSSIV